MSYGQKYSIQWKNREQTTCNILLLLKGFVGDSIELVGAEHPFMLRSQAQDNNIPYGIKATEAIIEFYSDGLVSLIDFYNEDDTAWLVETSNVDTGGSIWVGFLQLDNCSEQITDISHVISLNANDGLGRLQTQYFIDTGTFNLNQPLIRNWTLSELILGYILPSVGLNILVRVWLNIFENSTDDRTVHDYLTMLPETAFSTKYFINDDGTTQTLYDALNNILIDLRCVLTQADGVWQIMRWGDIRIFSDGTMPGTVYGSGGADFEAITFDAALDIGRGIEHLPINENQDGRILRPYQFSKETFNYKQPVFIAQYNLQIAKGATPFATNTTGGFIYDDYSIADYFDAWIQTHGDTSYLEVVSTDTTPPTETDRYIITPGATDEQRGIQLNSIPVTKGDSFDFSLQYRTDTDTDDTLRFWVRFILILSDATFYALAQFPEVGSSVNVHWTGPFSTDSWDANLGIYKENTNPSNIDTTQWQNWSISEFVETGGQLPLIPADGVMLMEVRGTNGSNSSNRQTTWWKSMVLTMNQYINQSTQIIGQFHNNSQDALIKNNLQYDIDFDDSPRNTILGTLFTNALSNFDYTDVTTGGQTQIGNVYFTKTALWHREGITEARRLGDLNTYNDLFMQRKIRTIIEGDFFGLSGVYLMRLINFTWLSPKKFIFGTASFDYMSCIWHATFYEIFETGEVDGDLDNTYLFNYIYNTK